jgi:hypothetical protein
MKEYTKFTITLIVCFSIGANLIIPIFKKEEILEDILPPLGDEADPVYGTIDAVVDSWEWDAQEGHVENPDALVRLGDSEYYMTSAAGDTGSDSDGFLRTFQVNDADGEFVKSIVSKWEYDTSDGLYAGITHISDDIYAVYYSDTSNGVLFTTRAWASNGTLQKTMIDSETYTKPKGEHLIHVTGDIYALTYQEAAGGYDHFLETYEITSAGAISARIDVVEYDSSSTSANVPFAPHMALVDSNTVAIVMCDSAYDGMLFTYDISDAGDITDTYADYWEFDWDKGSTPHIKKISGNVFAIAYQGTDGDGFVKTVTISDSGAITKSWIDELEFDTADCNYPTLFTVNDANDFTPGVYGVSYRGTDFDGFVSTFNITSAGDIGTVIDYLEFNTYNYYWAPCVHVADDYYLFVYEGTGYDGWACTVEISTAALYKEFSNPYPEDGAYNISTTATYNVTITHDKGTSMTVDFYSSTDQVSWTHLQTNNSVLNESVSVDLTGELDYDTIYYMKTTANDTTNNVSHITSFETTPYRDSFWNTTFPSENWIQSSVGMTYDNGFYNVTGYLVGTPSSIDAGDYCSASASSTAYMGISNVKFSNIDKDSPYLGESYEDYTDEIAEVRPGQTYTLSVTTSGIYNQGVVVWFDWSQDNTLETSHTVTTSISAGTYTYDVTIPSGFSGNTLMRVRSRYNTVPSDPCGSVNYGDVEDYTVWTGELVMECNITTKNITQQGTGWDKFYAQVNNTDNSTFSLIDPLTDYVIISNLVGDGDDISSVSNNTVRIRGDFNATLSVDSFNITWSTDRTFQEIQSGFFTFSNISSFKPIESGYFVFSSIDRSFQEIESGFFNFGNISSLKAIQSGFFTFSNKSSWSNIESGFFVFSSTSRTFQTIQSGHFTFSNNSVFRSIDSGYFKFSSTDRNFKNIEIGYFLFNSTDRSFQGTESGYFKFSNSSSIKQIESGYFIFNSEDRSFKSTETGYFTFSNSSSFRTTESGYFTFTSESRDWQTVESGYFVFDSTDRDWKNIDTGWFAFSNTSIFKNTESGWFTFSSTGRTIRDISSGYFVFSNSSSFENIDSGYFTFGNTSSLKPISSGYFKFSSIEGTFQKTSSGYFTFGNSSSFRNIDSGWFSFTAERGVFEVESGYFTFSNKSSFSKIDSGWFNFSATNRSWKNTTSGYFTFSNTASFKNTESGWFVFSNASTMRTIDSGWFKFNASKGWFNIDSGWFSFENTSSTKPIESGWFVFSNNSLFYGTPSPANNSKINLNFTFQIEITSPRGLSFDWNISCSNGQYNNATAEGNGTKNLSITNLSRGSLKIWVNTTCGSETISNWYYYSIDTLVVSFNYSTTTWTINLVGSFEGAITHFRWNVTTTNGVNIGTTGWISYTGQQITHTISSSEENEYEVVFSAKNNEEVDSEEQVIVLRPPNLPYIPTDPPYTPDEGPTPQKPTDYDIDIGGTTIDTRIVMGILVLIIVVYLLFRKRKKTKFKAGKYLIDYRREEK